MAALFHGIENKAYPVLVAIALGILWSLTYTITCFASSSLLRSFRKDKRPPLAPYCVPFLKHALAFFGDTSVIGEVQK